MTRPADALELLHRRPAGGALPGELRAPVAERLGVDPADLRLRPMGRRKGVADETIKFSGTVRGTPGPSIVVLCSAETAPDMAARGARCAFEARAALGPILGARVLTPIGEGNASGLSFTLFPFCLTTDRGGVLRRKVRRQLLGPALLRWLRSATVATLLPAGDETHGMRVAHALEHVAGESLLPGAMRDQAASSLDRLTSRRWNPRAILMHGDLWLGNVLLTGRLGLSFRIHDWPASQRQGYPFYDLIRIARSLGLGASSLHGELLAHCAIIGCGVEEARGYLLAALGHLGLHLEHFAPERYRRLARETWAMLDGLLPSPSVP